jgi:predicted MFS family arabinose efflux permease
MNFGDVDRGREVWLGLVDWNPWRGLGTLPRVVKTICAAALINRAGTMVLPYIAVWLIESRGFTAAEAGFAAPCYGAGSFVASAVGGKLTDRFGPGAVMRGGLAAAGVAILILPWFRARWVLYAAVFGWAALGEVFRPANLVALSTFVAPEDRKPALSLGRLAVNLGMSIGPALGGVLISISYWWLFAVDGATSIAAAVWLWFAVPSSASSIDGRRRLADRVQAKKRRVRFDRRLLYFLLAFAPMGFVFVQHQMVLLLYLVEDLHQPKAVYGLLMTINTVVIVFCELRLNFAMRRWPASRAMPLAAILVGAGFGMLAFNPRIEIVIVGWVAWTIGEMIALPAAAAYVAELAPEGETGRYMGAYQTVFSGIFAVGPWLGTLVYGRWGSRVLWAGVFGLAVASAGLLAGVRTRRT